MQYTGIYVLYIAYYLAYRKFTTLKPSTDLSDRDTYNIQLPKTRGTV